MTKDRLISMLEADIAFARKSEKMADPGADVAYERGYRLALEYALSWARKLEGVK